MYQPPAFREDRLPVLHDLIRAHPLGLLITHGAAGLMANPIPFLVDPSRGEHGVLLAHLARANGQIDDLRAGAEALIVFQGPHAYISPSWYASKAEHGKVVPTWNYVIVQAHGRPRVVDDAAWLRQQIGALTRSQEASRAEPWTVEDAPDDFVATQLKLIVGLEIPIDRIEGKWKMSQNRPAADRASVVTGLRADGWEDVANLVAERSAPV